MNKANISLMTTNNHLRKRCYDTHTILIFFFGKLKDSLEMLRIINLVALLLYEFELIKIFSGDIHSIKSSIELGENWPDFTSCFLHYSLSYVKVKDDYYFKLNLFWNTKLHSQYNIIFDGISFFFIYHVLIVWRKKKHFQYKLCLHYEWNAV